MQASGRAELSVSGLIRTHLIFLSIVTFFFKVGGTVSHHYLSFAYHFIGLLSSFLKSILIGILCLKIS